MTTAATRLKLADLFKWMKWLKAEHRYTHDLDPDTRGAIKELLFDDYGYTLDHCITQMLDSGGTCATCTQTCDTNKHKKGFISGTPCGWIHAWMPGPRWNELNDRQREARLYWRQLLGYDKRTVYTVNKLGNFPRRKGVK